MKYCITGGLGFVGNELTRQLKQKGEVCVLDSGYRTAQDIDDLQDVRIVRVDVTNPIEVSDAICALAPDVVIHLAAIHFIPECNANPALTMRVNVEGTLSVLLACVESRVKHFIFASSGAVYADSEKALLEQDPVDPVDIYGISKKMAEDLCQWIGKSHQLPITIMRLFNVYGPRETNAHIIPEILGQLKKGNVLRLGNTKPVRDYIFVSDVASAIEKITGHIPSGVEIFNLSSGHSASVDELVAALEKILGRKIELETDPQRFRKADKQIQKADIGKITKALNWSPVFDIENGLRKLLSYEGLS